MGSRRAQVEDLIRELHEMGCETSETRGHYRVLFNGVYVGAVGFSPTSTNGLVHSRRKIRQRIASLRDTGRTW